MKKVIVLLIIVSSFFAGATSVLKPYTKEIRHNLISVISSVAVTEDTLYLEVREDVDTNMIIYHNSKWDNIVVITPEKTYKYDGVELTTHDSFEELLPLTEKPKAISTPMDRSIMRWAAGFLVFLGVLTVVLNERY